MLTTRPIALDAVAALRERVGEVVAPGDTGWDQAREAWNLVVDQRPVAVALPRDAGEVAATLAVARHHGLRVAPQGTGHNATPLADLSDAILLRTDRMRDVLIDPLARIARVGAGVAVGGGDRPRGRARPDRPPRLVPQRGRGGLLARRRHRLARAQPRPRGQLGDGHRDRHRGRRDHPHRRGP